MEYLLGIDLGTSGVKTVLFDSSGTAVCLKSQVYPLYQPQNGWAEQDPEDWWNAVVGGIQNVLSQSGIPAWKIRGIGISGQMHGLVMLDRNGTVLRKSILWCDQRTGQECEQMNRVIGQKRLLEITANPALTGFTASKILWVQNNEPEIWEKCAHILLPKDFIRYKLTGEFATEVSDASGMQLMNVAERCWSEEILDKLKIGRSLLPAMYESTDVTGKVHKRAAQETGLQEGIPVVGGAGDNAAAAVGTGVVREGYALTTIGTSGVIYAVTDHYSVDPHGRIHTLCASVPGKWVAMSCTQAAGLSLKWLRDNFCQMELQQAEQQKRDPYQIMDSMAEQIQAGADGLLFLPYLMGERSPHPDPDCRGVFFGLSAFHSRAHLIRAVMEGVGFSQKECLNVFHDIGVNVNRMVICGGGGRSRLWRQILSDLYCCPVSTVAVAEGPALGVALLAGVGTGMYASVDEACSAVLKPASTQVPNRVASKAYEKLFSLYQKLYMDLKDDFNMLAGFQRKK